MGSTLRVRQRVQSDRFLVEQDESGETVLYVRPATVLHPDALRELDALLSGLMNGQTGPPGQVHP